MSGEFAAKTIYGTIGGDRHLKLKGLDPRMKYLNEVRITCMPASILIGSSSVISLRKDREESALIAMTSPFLLRKG